MPCIQLLLQPYKSGIFLLEMKTRKTEENRFEWLGISGVHPAIACRASTSPSSLLLHSSLTFEFMNDTKIRLFIYFFSFSNGLFNLTSSSFYDFNNC